jgi:hypothetical protein
MELPGNGMAEALDVVDGPKWETGESMLRPGASSELGAGNSTGPATSAARTINKDSLTKVEFMGDKLPGDSRSIVIWGKDFHRESRPAGFGNSKSSKKSIAQFRSVSIITCVLNLLSNHEIEFSPNDRRQNTPGPELADFKCKLPDFPMLTITPA